MNEDLSYYIKRAILLNNDVSMQAEDPRTGGQREEDNSINYYFQPKGSPIEVGMVRFVDTDPNMDINDTIRELKQKYPIHMLQPFDQEEKTMMTINYSGNDNEYLITLKGAPEYVVSRCVKSFNGDDGEVVDIDEEVQADLLQRISDQQASTGQKVISYAQATMDGDMFGLIKEKFGNSLEAGEAILAKINKKRSEEEDEDGLFVDFEYLGTFGLEDEIVGDNEDGDKKGVLSSIMQLRYGQDTQVELPKEEMKKYCKVRIITGDHPETAKAIAKRSGVLPMDESQIKESNLMNGQDFYDAAL